MNRIIKALKDSPNKSINKIALEIGVSANEVGKAQRDYYKPFLKRDSKMWGINGSVLNDRQIKSYL